jgi:hypothetical protein
MTGTMARKTGMTITTRTTTMLEMTETTNAS